jgi:CheY-like chemotaxis protein
MAYNLEQLAIMVVDDNHHMVVLVKHILVSLGIKNVREARDSADAIELLGSYPCDIVICDYNMQPLDGVDFVKLLRTSPDSPNAHVAVIMMTGHTEYRTVAAGRDAGVNEFLAKPISVKSLCERIVHVIEKPRPFIRSRRYTGPDRRRKQVPFDGPERRKTQPLAESPKQGLSDAEIEAMLQA